MISWFTSTCVAPQAVLNEHQRVAGYHHRLVHTLAPFADLCIGITALVVGILSLTCPSMGINLSTGLQGALIGGGAIYAGVAFLQISSHIKHERFPMKFLIGKISQVGYDPSE